MDSPDDVFFAEDRCEVCGGRLGDEVIIQEFADGSLARLCAECAAGAALDEQEQPGESLSVVIWPTEPAEISGGASVEFDPLEKTRELLAPVTDLITLQAEMQNALERLASSLERFATEMLTESQDKSAVENRLQMLERELDETRTRLAETEFLLVNTFETAPGALANMVAGSSAAEEPPGTRENASGGIQHAAPGDQAEPLTPPTEDLWSLVEARAQGAASEAGADGPGSEAAQLSTGEPSALLEETEQAFESETGSIDGPNTAATPETTADTGAVTDATAAADAGAAADTGAVAAEASIGAAHRWDRPPAQEQEMRPEVPAQEGSHGTGFRIDEVQAAQRYYNESPFTDRIRDVSNSLGRPEANLTRLPGEEPRAIVTVAWDIVWYQYLIDLRRDLPPTQGRVTLHREGMDLEELAYYFREPNALINDDGRLDASELEVRLLSDPSALLTEMTHAEMRALEDATEEIWDQRIAPEFKWDD